MFGILNWDSPLQLLVEIAFALVVMIGIMWLVRRVNANSRPIGTVAPPLQGSASTPDSPRQDTGSSDTARESRPT